MGCRVPYSHQDMSQPTPTQELVAKDLHGFEWRFKHIFRGICWIFFYFICLVIDQRLQILSWIHEFFGIFFCDQRFLVICFCSFTDINGAGQPRRHLLTTGWSTFVTSKRLVVGDAFVFLRYVSLQEKVSLFSFHRMCGVKNMCFYRGESGELRVGVRRLAKQQIMVPSSVISTRSMYLGVLATASHAISTGTLFVVYYKPRLELLPEIVIRRPVCFQLPFIWVNWSDRLLELVFFRCTIQDKSVYRGC